MSYNQQSLSGVTTISDGIATMTNGVITCNELYVGGVDVNDIIASGEGPAGPTGPAGEVTVGATTTLDAGEDASVENVGTSTDAVLIFTFHRVQKVTKETKEIKETLVMKGQKDQKDQKETKETMLMTLVQLLVQSLTRQNLLQFRLNWLRWQLQSQRYKQKLL